MISQFYQDISLTQVGDLRISQTATFLDNPPHLHMPKYHYMCLWEAEF